MVLLVVLEVFTKNYIAGSFGVSSSGMISLEPLGVMGLVGLGVLLVVSCILALALRRVDFSNRDH